jgi:hypothetical protein
MAYVCRYQGTGESRAYVGGTRDDGMKLNCSRTSSISPLHKLVIPTLRLVIYLKPNRDTCSVPIP